MSSKSSSSSGSNYTITKQVQAELDLIREVKQMAEEAHLEKSIRQDNNNRIRSWRLKLRINLYKQETSKKQQLEWQNKVLEINKIILQLNNKLEINAKVNNDITANVALTWLDNCMKQLQKFKTKLNSLADEEHDIDLSNLQVYATQVSQLKEQLEAWKEKNKSSFEYIEVIDDKKADENKRNRQLATEMVQAINRKIGYPLYQVVSTEDSIDIKLNQAAYADYLTWLRRLNRQLAVLVSEEYDNVNLNFNQFRQELASFLSFGSLDYSEQAYLAYLENRRMAADEDKRIETMEYEYLANFPLVLYTNTKKIVAKHKEIPPIDLHVSPDIDYLKVRDIEEGIPSLIVDELKGYSQGSYDRTRNNVARINDIASQYSTPTLELKRETMALSNDFRRKVDQLLAYANNVGQGQRNSMVGLRLISRFKSKTENLLYTTDKQAIAFSNAYSEFKRASNALENWINKAWWQFGGLGERDKRVYRPKRQARKTGLPSLKSNKK